MSQPTLEIDHVFVLSEPGAPEAAALLALGISEGSPNEHPGQGTACRRFFVPNAYLELLWVEEPREARAPAIAPTRLFDRWTGRRDGACPFGIGLRPATQTLAGPGDSLPFPGWEFRPPYLPPHLALHVAGNSDRLDEPLLFHLPFGRRPDSVATSLRQPQRHPAGIGALSALILHQPTRAPASPELAGLEARGLLTLRHGSAHLLELEFDRGAQGRRADLTPELPIVLRW